MEKGKHESGAKWDGLKGYLTNTDIPAPEVYAAYHNLWYVERAFRISKSKIEIRPMFHFTRRRIESYNLKGKTVISFATSGGSTIDNSVKELKKAYPDINWKEGKLLNGADKRIIRQWLKK